MWELMYVIMYCICCLFFSGESDHEVMCLRELAHVPNYTFVCVCVRAHLTHLALELLTIWRTEAD